MDTDRDMCEWCGRTGRLRRARRSPATGEQLRRCEACDRFVRRSGRERPFELIELALDREADAAATAPSGAGQPPRPSGNGAPSRAERVVPGAASPDAPLIDWLMRHPGDDVEVAPAPSWMLDAACAAADPDAFFPEKGGSTREAKRICVRCPVRTDCLEYALVEVDPLEVVHEGVTDELTRYRFGVFGGLSARERLAYARATHQAA